VSSSTRKRYEVHAGERLKVFSFHPVAIKTVTVSVLRPQIGFTLAWAITIRTFIVIITTITSTASWRTFGTLKEVCFPFECKPPTSRTPRTKLKNIGDIAFGVRRETTKRRTWSRTRIWSSFIGALQGANQSIKFNHRGRCLANVSLRLLYQLADRPLGHFRVKPILSSVALFEQVP
jgi:hypothetical protein